MCQSKYEWVCFKLKSNGICSFLCVSRTSVMLLLCSAEVCEFKDPFLEKGILLSGYFMQSSVLCTVSNAETSMHLF